MTTDSLLRLVELIRGRRVAVLAGAGMSTDSGIPDYRSPGRPQRTPIQHREFLRSAAIRQRYWARSYVGWSMLAEARANAGHEALATLEAAGVVRGVITQNVDGLHGVAGSKRVVELHGALRDVLCLGCGERESRAELQARMAALNPTWEATAGARPDGDAELDGDAIGAFVTPACLGCNGVLKPDVVFFGDNVRPAVLAAAWEIFDEADVLLVVGSSLAVFSGYRFVKRAAERAMPVGICNLGPTRGDPLATLKVEAPLSRLLPELAAMSLT